MIFSIISVTRNNEAGLRRTYDSLCAQDCADYEWIVIDGASADGSVEFLKAIQAQFLSEADHGIYDAMNKGLARAKGDYVLFLNAGDVLADPHILSALAELTAQNPALIYGDGREGVFYKPARSHTALKWGLFTYHQALLYRRAAIDDLRYDTRFPVTADFKFTAEFLQKQGTVIYWPHAVCDFEGDGLSQKLAGQARRELAKIRTDLGLCRPWENYAILAGQTATAALRQYFPGIYKGIRGAIRPRQAV